MVTNALRFIQETIYALKHEYGVAITITRGNPDTSVDWGAGGTVDAATITSYTISKAILLPKRQMRSFEAMFTKIAENVDVTLRSIIIDGADISIDPEEEDLCIFDSITYTIKEVVDLDHDLGFIIRVKNLEGQ